MFNVYEKLLFESNFDNEMAFFKLYTARTRLGFAYRKNALINLIDRNSTHLKIEDLHLLIKRCALATITIAAPDASQGTCNNAWEVINAAGPEQGKLTYGMGYHMSESGLLMPDRSSITDQAIKGWISARNKSEGIPLDDINHPGEGIDEFHDEHHTENSKDDCVTYPIRKNKSLSTRNKPDEGLAKKYADAINRAYALGDMGYDFKKMSLEHDKVVSFIVRILDRQNPTERQIMTNFKMAANDFFKQHYGDAIRTASNKEYLLYVL